ncbi:MAG: class I SAM-dependent methyltransferase [Kofleriaceae bacterium]
MEPRSTFIPALRFHWLTPLYDPLIRSWRVASRMRSSVIDALELRPGLRLLELGAGSGRLAIEIKRRHPDVTIEGIDADTTMVARATRNAASAGVEVGFRHGDMAELAELAELGRFDRVYSTMVFHHLSLAAKRRALEGALAALTPAGRFVVTDFGRPRDLVQRALFTLIQQPFDGFENTAPHRDGRYEHAIRDTFRQVQSAGVWRSAVGTVEMFVCSP